MTLETLETEVSEQLESKKTEVTFTAGCARGTQECAKSHSEFIDKSREELQVLVTESGLSPEVANFALGWLAKSQKFLTDFAASMKTSNDVRSGEALALDAVKRKIKAMRAAAEDAAKKPEEPPAPVAATPAEAPRVEEAPLEASVAEEVSQKKPKKKRPDERGEAAKTVKRLKESRQKKAAEKSQ